MSQVNQALIRRPRRLRQDARWRAFVQSQHLHAVNFIMPLFIKAGDKICQPIQSMPGQFQYSLDQLPQVAERLAESGIQNVLLFGVVQDKDPLGQAAAQSNGLIQQAIQILKHCCPHWLVIADLCFCEYTDHGHCGVLDANGQLDNDATLPHLVAQAVSLSKAGADLVAPSGMLDGMVAAVRAGLDAHGHTQCGIMSYAVKYASGLYAPFREAGEGAPQSGDRLSHQMHVANGEEALLEARLDVEQGADMLLIKPGYGDVVYRVTQQYPDIPVGAYHVSGSYAMIKAAAEKGWLNEAEVIEEVMLGYRRAGAQFIVTYFADWITQHLC